MWEMVKNDTSSSKSRDLLEMDKILGLRLAEYLSHPVELPKDVIKLINKRERIRKSGDFKTSDKLRKQIKEIGYEIEDTPKGPKAKAS